MKADGDRRKGHLLELAKIAAIAFAIAFAAALAFVVEMKLRTGATRGPIAPYVVAALGFVFFLLPRARRVSSDVSGRLLARYERAMKEAEGADEARNGDGSDREDR